MLNAEQYLNLINQRGRERKPLNRVIDNIVKRQDLFLNAYGKIYANKGATTPGVDGESLDGITVTKINKIIHELRTRTFRWQPVKRVYIPKKNGKLRPLGIPGWKDKLVQEVLRVVLEAYYEPQFSNMSHGFRPGRSCHSAMYDINGKARGAKWFIEGDIKGCFDNISHEILMQNIAKNIKDKSFLKLLNGMLKAGYMEDWTYNQTFSGTPQGGIITPPTMLQTTAIGA